MFADPGMTITWNCKAVARPSATYSWYKNGVLLENKPGHIEIARNILKIVQVTIERDEGMYQCAATNQHGTTFSSGQLKVLCKFDRLVTQYTIIYLFMSRLIVLNLRN